MFCLHVYTCDIYVYVNVVCSRVCVYVCMNVCVLYVYTCVCEVYEYVM